MSIRTVSVQEAEKRLAELIGLAQQGDEIVIARMTRLKSSWSLSPKRPLNASLANTGAKSIWVKTLTPPCQRTFGWATIHEAVAGYAYLYLA